MEIGVVVLAKLAESIEKYRPNADVTREEAAVRELLRVARHRARATGQSVKTVLQNHRKALEQNPSAPDAKFVLSSSHGREHNNTAHRREAEREAMNAAMALQDDRRASHTVSRKTQLVAEAVDAREAARDRRGQPRIGYVRPELQPPSDVGRSTGVLRLPAPRDTLVPISMRLKDTQVGGMHNPMELSDDDDDVPLSQYPLALQAPARPHYLMDRASSRPVSRASSSGGSTQPSTPAPPTFPTKVSGPPAQAAERRTSGRARASVNYAEEDVPMDGGDTYGVRPGRNFGKVKKVTKDGKVIYDVYQGG